MNIIHSLIDFTKLCQATPLFLLDEKVKTEAVAKLKIAAGKLRELMSNEENKGTSAGDAVEMLWQSVGKDDLDEQELSVALGQVYEAVSGTNNPAIANDLEELKKYLDVFKYRALHHKIRSEYIEKTCQNLPPEKRAEHDQKVLKEKLIFYVVEYTLEVARWLRTMTSDDQKKLIETGMKVATGNLPGLKEFMKSYKEEVAYTVCDAAERHHLLKIFLDYEETLAGNDYAKIIKELDVFNRELLKVALKFGITTFTGLILKPYPDNTPVVEIIKELE
jgi:hypothetical protein